MDQLSEDRSHPRHVGIDGPTETPPVVDLAHALVDHTSEIARDAIAITRLEVKRAAIDLLPRVALGLTALVLGAIGGVLGAIALFIALGAVIPSFAWRLAIYALALVALGVVGVLLATGRFGGPSSNRSALAQRSR